ncbi:MAG: prolyl oligopeptidase family serine peptidase [Vicinamibacterales bacterium]
MTRMLAGLLSASALVAAVSAAPARTPSSFPLTIDSIMRGPALVGYPPTDLRWSGDSQELYFEWRMPGEDEAATWVVGRDGGEPRRLTDEQRTSAPPPGGVWDRARRRVLGVQEGNVVLIDTVARTRRALTRTTARESSPRWARHETHVTFVRDNNVFIVPVDGSQGNLFVQLSDVSAKKPDPAVTESQTFIKEEELKLLEAVKEAAERRKRNEEKEKRNALPKFDLQERQSVADAALAEGEVLYLLITERPANLKTAIVPNYVTESAYTEDITTRTKVGDTQNKTRLAVFDLETAKTAWASVPGVDEKRDLRWSMPVVSDDGRHAVAAARAGNNEDRWFVLLSREGTGKVVDHMHDSAWVRDPGFAGWLPDHRRFWFGAEKDGWAHLYTVDVTADTRVATALTSGRWEVAAAALSQDGTRFYISTTEVHPGERHIYSVPADGGVRTKLTSMTGASFGVVAPDDSMLGVIYSYMNKPPEVYLMVNQPGATLTKVTTSTSAEWRGGKWFEPELVTFKARDGIDVPARLYTPERLGARRDRNAPAVIFVHGAGYLQNAHRYWSTYFREYMFHHVLASRGYVVLDVDYRGSAGYGRGWRTAIYRHMGGKDLDDIVDGAKYLVEKHRVHPRRLGVYGGSYGGFITLMAMFTSPKTFAAGAALRPVTDWAHYNHPYTSNILNEPQADGEAYRRSSPIYFADKLEGALLILHGMVDVNVHFQDSVRLAQRLIELRKENWELAAYPVEDHGFVKETSWADEYKRILKLFDLHLRGVVVNGRITTD